MDAVRFQAEQAPKVVDLKALMAALSPERRENVDEVISRAGYPGTKSFFYGLANWANYRQDELTEVERFYVSKSVDWLHRPRLGAARLLDNLPISMFFMLPAFALLLAIFYRKKQRFYVQQLVFSIHVHVLAFAVFTALALLPERTVGGILGLVLAPPPVAYHFAALLHYYGDGPVLTSYCGIWCTGVGHAAALLPSMTSMPSLNLTPSITLPTWRKPRSRRQDFFVLLHYSLNMDRLRTLGSSQPFGNFFTP